MWCFSTAPHSPRKQKLNLRMKSLSLDSPESTEHVQRRRHVTQSTCIDPQSSQSSSSRIQCNNYFLSIHCTYQSFPCTAPLRTLESPIPVHWTTFNTVVATHWYSVRSSAEEPAILIGFPWFSSTLVWVFLHIKSSKSLHIHHSLSSSHPIRLCTTSVVGIASFSNLIMN
jgi:hypothetical protein